MPKPYDSNFAMEPPKDLPLSPKVKSLRKTYQDAKKAIDSYAQENARYRMRDVSEIWESKPRYSSVALEEAKRGLKDAEIAAVEAGKPLPDKDEFLAPVKAKMDEYTRTVSALKTVAQRAKQAYSDAVFSELKDMGLKEAQKTAKAREEWEQAYRAMVAAKATLDLHASLFSWCLSAGGMDFYPTQGHSQGENLEVWELTEDGRLTFEAAKALDYRDYMVKVDGLIEPDPNPPAPVEPWTVKHTPQQHYSKPVGHEYASYVGEVY
ncbi:hypothetical protein [Streptomyces triticisoli]|uniref:hypothetical protein n=1 Tax=Streptomyces triticisoli TaxID=2182797 RepID=UPI001300BED9|nr:hypothetical protein [Streptomyces triticisoli]